MSTTNTSTPFTLRHAPRTLDDLVFADPLVREELALYARRETHRSLILYGTWGTGKSTAARVIVEERRALLGITGPYNHADSGGNFDESFDGIENTISYLLFEGDPEPYLIIDEIEQLTPKHQLALRQMMDQFPVIRFIGTTNEINKVDGGIRDRCECLCVMRPQSSDWLPRCRTILTAEGVTTTDARLLTIINNTPKMRDMLQELELLVQRLRNAGAVLPPPQLAQVVSPTHAVP